MKHWLWRKYRQMSLFAFLAWGVLRGRPMYPAEPDDPCTPTWADICCAWDVARIVWSEANRTRRLRGDAQ